MNRNTRLTMKRHSTILTRTAILLLAIVAFSGAFDTVKAQESHKKFTLTDGRLYWMDATSCDLNYLYPVAFDRSHRWAKIHKYGNLNVTHYTKQGKHYLTLDLSNPNEPKVGQKLVSEGFDPYCVWTRTGSTGYYYQVHGNYRYFLVGTPDTLRVVRKGLNEAIDNATYWYDWDFGAAITNITFRDGVRNETNHWIYYDTVGLTTDPPREGAGFWTMCKDDCYQRPEDIIFDTITGDPARDSLARYYYYSYKDANNMWHAYGNGALYLPVEQIDMPITIINRTNTVTASLSSTTLNHGETSTNTLTVPGTLTAYVRPSYTIYREETERCGINLNYDLRKTPGFGFAGDSTISTYYYKDGARIDDIPDAESKDLTVASVTYSLHPRLRRYLELYGTDPDQTTIRDTTVTTASADGVTQPFYIHCYSIPSSNITNDLRIYIKYSFTHADETYYVYDTLVQQITVTNYIPQSPDREPINAPVIYGYVCGGGRMANVGYANGEIVGGNPSITVHNTDTLWALYGGNDIAGWVQGTASIQIGSLQTVSPLRINYLYGGGCGYYSYSTVYDATANPPTWAADNEITDVVGYGNYCFGNGTNTGKVYPWKYQYQAFDQGDPDPNEAFVIAEGFGYEPWTDDDFAHKENGQSGNGTIPYIKKAHINIGIEPTIAITEEIARTHNDLIKLDTVFGGAENAFIGVDGFTGDEARATTIDVYGGTIMAVFGGNNYGGSVAQGAHTYIEVHNTKLTDELAIENSYYSGYGRDFGIRNLFGGGNKVESAHAEVTIRGGMIDTCFLGGNEASVVQPLGTINCRGEKFIYDNPALGVIQPKLHDGETDNPYYVNLQATTISNEIWNRFLTANPGAYDSEMGRYNVRCLFGGNNKAPMTNLSYIHLASGGVCYAYGGGNEGDMNNATPWNSNYYKRYSDGTIEGQEHADGAIKVLDLGDSVRGSFDGWIYEMPTVFGSMINSPQNSRIIVESIYGGCRKANVLYSSGLSLSGGVFGYVQGGCDVSGDVGSRHAGEGSWVILDSNVIVLQDVYGGNDGYYHCHLDGRYTEEDVVSYNNEPYDTYHDHVGLLVPTQNNSNLYIHGGTVLFSAYGGGVMCDVGFKLNNPYYIYDHVTGTQSTLVPAAGYQNGAIHFYMNGGTVGSAYWHHNAQLIDGSNAINADLATRRAAAKSAGDLANHDGNAYGGGYLSSLYGASYFYINSDTRDGVSPQLHSKVYGSVYAGNDCMGSIASFASYANTREGHEVAPENYYASNGTTLLNGADKAIFDAYVLIQGKPRIANVFGSGNGAYNYDGSRPEYSSLEPVCYNSNENNRPYQSSTFIDINTSGGFIDTVFGGGNGVGVREDAQILLNTQSKYNLERGDSLFVGTIFGGNNRDDMNNCVPDIVLKQGTVKNVYGGGNAGSMNMMEPFTDVCGNDVVKVSTYVRVESDNVHITDNLFGGCRMADVEGMAYIDIRNTDEEGINYVYGGNDISGSVKGNTRIDFSNGYINHLYGGSNGYYDYENMIDAQGHDSIVVWELGHLPATHNQATNLASPYLVALNSSGSPYVDDTKVNLYGGTVRNSVYGGGRLGDCRNTTVVVNDRQCAAVEDNPATPDVDETAYRELHILGAVYGGGEGLWNDLSLAHRGNTGQNTTRSGDEAIGSSQVHLHHATELRDATAYGGGRGGDAYETFVYAYNTWDHPFNAIYGGCWGSDVINGTHVILEGNTISEGSINNNNYTALNVYGGNDFTGNVHDAEIIINSGTYGNIYGAGDGYGGLGGEDLDGNGGITEDGDYAQYYAGGAKASTYSTAADLLVPNTERTTVTVYDARVTGNLYGGGKMGTTFRYKTDENNIYVLDGDGKKIADTNMAYNEAYDDPLKYAYAITNIHGGKFDHHIFAGASGKLKGKTLIYGLKELNMEGGVVSGSIFGGSANVSDGYGRECVDEDHTTMRPSSIINYSGGSVGNSVYGGGYLGIIHGSAYINVGVDAIANSKIWEDNDSAYAIFMPGRRNSLAPALSANELTIQSSIYSGPNWGNSSGSADFTTPGVFGGITRIFLDGNRYSTDNAEAATEPTMNIRDGSIIGAGTSAAGGDVYSRIDVRNYGAIVNCVPTRTLKAIQRADGVWLNNTAIKYTGSTDAISAYISTQYTFNHIDTLNTVGYNVLHVNYAITNIGYVNYFEDAAYPYIHKHLTSNLEMADCYGSTCAACNLQDGDDGICEQLRVIDPVTKKYPALFIDGGINVDFVNESGRYSDINGFAFLLAPQGTNAVVTASPKFDTVGVDLGGFMTACADSLKALIGAETGALWNLQWCNCVRFDENRSYDGEPYSGSQPADNQWTTNDCFNGSETHQYDAQFPYYNYSTRYRVWSLGNGTRRRFAVVQAHSNVNNSAENKQVTLHYQDKPTDPTVNKVYNLAVAHSTLTLPPTTPGHYYKINSTYGIDLIDENEEMSLVDQAYNPTGWSDLFNHWGLEYPTTQADYSSQGELVRTITQTGSDPDTYDTTWSGGVLEPAAHGHLVTLGVNDGSVAKGASYIYNNPNNTFGLMMTSGTNFATYTQADADADRIPTGSQVGDLIPPAANTVAGGWTGGTPISGNNYVNTLFNFSTAQVGSTTNASPVIDLYMLYNNHFNNTLLGTVKMVLDEYEYIQRRNAQGELIITNPDHDDNPSAPEFIVIAHLNPDGTDNYDVQKPGGGYYTSADIEMYEHNIQAPIEVEITLATILEDFTDMENMVLAMYNEGRSDIFTRKIVLPATLETRELYLTGVTWNPTDNMGENLPAVDANDPNQFYLTDKHQTQILDAPGTDHNRFGMRISTSDNISNTLTSSVGWLSQNMATPRDIYQMAGYTAVDKKRASDDAETADSYTIGKKTFDIPQQLGVLDGRGEAAINVDLLFDGSRIYGDPLGLGYVGKVILHMKSINTEDRDENEFDLTIYVKTRAKGDTIYLATKEDYVERNGIRMYSHSSGSSDGGTTPRTTEIDKTCGKEPNDYLHTFYEAFTGPYQEGDVIAILDSVIIPENTSVFIKGVEHMPVQVIRYSGHHHQFPGEKCAYRGPMITVRGDDATFTARCITFNGSMLTKTKPYKDDGLWDGISQATWESSHTQVLTDYAIDNEGTAIKKYDKYADTLVAYGPIVRVKDGGKFTMQNATIVERNYNEYAGADASLHGAISVTAGGTLEMINNVTIRENMSKKLTGDSPVHPLNGAVYVDGGQVHLLTATNDQTAILAYQNLQVENTLTTTNQFWAIEEITIQGLTATDEPVHYAFDPTHAIFAVSDGHLLNTTDYSLANIYLTRTAKNNPDDELNDTKTDILHLATAPRPGSRLGISKWFPGETVRDTIQIAFQPTSTLLNDAVNVNHNFISDDGYNVFYNYGVNTQRVYLHRCATFKYQQMPLVHNDLTGEDEANPTQMVAGSNIWLDSALDYWPRLDARCPTGGDKVINRVQGGFFPYTYTWTDNLNGTGNELRSRTSAYTTIATNLQIEHGNYTALRDAVADTLFTPAVQMSHTETNRSVNYSVTVSDVTGFCPMTKNVTINLVKDVSGNPVTPFVKNDKDNWASLTSPGETATGTRTYEAITIHPRVWADRSQGTIAAQIVSGRSDITDSIYTEDADGNHPIEGMSFCEGDVILLSTSPRYTGSPSNPTYTSKFVMWDFSPYYSNPVAFVVPPYSTEVVAYYSPLDYWINAVNNVNKGGVAYDNNYTYSSRPSVTPYDLEVPVNPLEPETTEAGYVTTYHGDVHIYNENGLAWFISVVNGLNGTQARPFFFNNVYLHQKPDGDSDGNPDPYDMKKHKWTPVGTQQHRFRGAFIGVGSDEASTTPELVTIENIIVDEPDLEYAGFFAFLDSAVVDHIKLQGELIRGSQYVGGVAANSVHSKILNSKVLNSTEPDPNSTSVSPVEDRNPSLTILTTHHTSGGVIGRSDHDSIDNCEVAAKYVGDAVYNGGMVGYGSSSRISNNGILNVNRMTSVYSGGAAGYLDGKPYTATSKKRRAKAIDDERSYVMNNYVRYDNEGRNQRVGGLVGLAKNTVIENNYVYGHLDGQSTEGGVGAELDSGAAAMHNYYEETSTGKGVGHYHADATSTHSSQFGGKGNQVTLAQRDYGVDNLTRVLNIWVRAHGDDYRTWRSDLEGRNSGYPLFGTPDMIPVRDSLTVTGCDSVEWDGVTYLFDDEVVSNIVDSVMMVDSTFILRIVVNHASREQFTDTVTLGDSYSGYGFYLTATEVALLQASMVLHGSASIVLNDTLQSMLTGCDSIITLTLTVNRQSGIVETPTEQKLHVYPNPTTSRVTIESTAAMSHVELYDNEGRRLQDYNTRNANDITIDVSHFPTGAYYLRVHTADNVTIQKLIKK